MTLPDTCPLDNSTKCKGLSCHLFCLEWRTKEPICLIGYGATSRKRASKTERKMDTYAEETFSKLGKQALPKSKTCSEKGDWTPRRKAKVSPEKPAERKEGKGLVRDPLSSLSEDPLSTLSKRPLRSSKEAAVSPEEQQKNSLRKISSNETEAKEKTTISTKKEKTAISTKLQPQETQEKPKVQEKIILRDKHATIFASCDENEADTCHLPRREEKPKKPVMSEEKRKKLDDVMELDLPDNYEEEFWS